MVWSDAKGAGLNEINRHAEVFEASECCASPGDALNYTKRPNAQAIVMPQWHSNANSSAKRKHTFSASTKE